MKYLSILGSTGSIGRNCLKIVEKFPDRLCVKAISGARNIKLLSEQIKLFKPEGVAVIDKKRADLLRGRLGSGLNPKIFHGPEGYARISAWPGTDICVAAIVGSAGLIPTMSAIDAGIDIALANKETLVMAGRLVMDRAAEKKVRILPVDSEHSAIFQSLMGNNPDQVDKILLTASGGPFLNTRLSEMSKISPEKALKHPNWEMGPKITIDSATLMNKGLEVIEARWLFSIPENRIKVLIHPQSIVHSMVAYIDGSVIAQLGIPDMKGAIAFALTYPDRLNIGQPIPNFPGIDLTFEEPDLERFPCLKLALEACKCGGTMPGVLNAANEIAVSAFLNKRISFSKIADIVKKTMDNHKTSRGQNLEEILEADLNARKFAEKMIKV